MRRIVIWLGSTITVVVLLFGYRTSTNATSVSAESSTIIPGITAAPPTSSGSGSGSGAASQGSSSGSASSGGSVSSGSPSTSATSAPASSAQTSTHTGSVVQTRWGPVQVQITVSGGKITAVDVLQYPQGNGKDQQINAYALPILVQDTISAQSANIDMVSGATVTSEGYLQSLQSALDEAGI